MLNMPRLRCSSVPWILLALLFFTWLDNSSQKEEKPSFVNLLNEQPLRIKIYLMEAKEKRLLWITDIDYKPNVFEEKHLTVPVTQEILTGEPFLVVEIEKYNNETIALTEDYLEDTRIARYLLFEKEIPRATRYEQRRFWKPKLDIKLVYDNRTFLDKPPKYYQYSRAKEGRQPFYRPPFIVNDALLVKDDMIHLDQLTSTLPLNLTFQTIDEAEYEHLYVTRATFQYYKDSGISGKDIDDLKQTFSKTPPYIRNSIYAISVLHVILDLLAFGSDIRFWWNRTDMEGISIRSMFWESFFQIIIFLYLVDNEASVFVSIPAFIWCVVDIWKLTRALKWKVRFLYGVIPVVSYADMNSYEEETKEYDQTAVYYLSMVIFPIIFGYSVYSLIYHRHYGWYSWLLSSLAFVIYGSGFILMTPQLFINYKLKSVAHLPLNKFLYKALNTFIDDAFAFVIKMPTLHRLSCFRDDLVFFIYLYQRWIYSVDLKRTNEYGEVFVDEYTGEQELQGNKYRVHGTPDRPVANQLSNGFYPASDMRETRVRTSWKNKLKASRYPENVDISPETLRRLQDFDYYCKQLTTDLKSKLQ